MLMVPVKADKIESDDDNWDRNYEICKSPK
jgi:hypothetical protein